MSSFFKSEQVQKSLTRMQELYVEINRMGVILSPEEKKVQLEKMLDVSLGHASLLGELSDDDMYNTFPLKRRFVRKGMPPHRISWITSSLHNQT